MLRYRSFASSVFCQRVAPSARRLGRDLDARGCRKPAASQGGAVAGAVFRTAAAAPACLLIAALSVLCGCQNAAIQASKLPPEYAAVRSQATRNIDLSSLARNSVRSEAIYPGDVLDVTIATGLEEKSPESWPLRVSDAGDIAIPLVGIVHVAGLLLPDAEQLVRRECITRRLYRDPLVSVLLRNRKTIRVTIVGAVKNPGAYELPAINSDLLAALNAAGGLNEQASTIVEIRNMGDANILSQASGGQQRPLPQAGSVRVDLIAAGQGFGPEYRIDDGSVIMVREEEPKTIQVIGLVKKPDQLEIPPGKDVRLLDAIAMAGGLTLEIADKVQVIRNLDGANQPVVIQASIREAKQGGQANLLLAPGDVVSVEETFTTFAITVIRDFVGIGLTSPIPGM